MQEHLVARHKPEVARGQVADENLSAVQGELSAFDDLINLELFCAVLRIKRHELFRDKTVADLEQDGRGNDRKRSSAVFFDGFGDGFRVRHVSSGERIRLCVRGCVEQLFLHLVREAGHDGEDDDENADAERHADYGDQSDDRDSTAFRFEIFPGKEQIRVMNHGVFLTFSPRGLRVPPSGPPRRRQPVRLLRRMRPLRVPSRRARWFRRER